MKIKLAIVYICLFFCVSANKLLQPNIRLDENFVGSKSAPITIVAYTSFQCPFSSMGFEKVEKLLNKYEGRIRLVNKHLPLDQYPHAKLAAQFYEAIRLQDSQKALAFQKTLFEKWNMLSEGSKSLEVIAQELKIDIGSLYKDLNSDRVLNRIRADESEAQNFGITSTPAYIMNGQLIEGAMPISHFEALIPEVEKKTSVVPEANKKEELGLIVAKKIDCKEPDSTECRESQVKEYKRINQENDKIFLGYLKECKPVKLISYNYLTPSYSRVIIGPEGNKCKVFLSGIGDTYSHKCLIGKNDQIYFTKDSSNLKPEEMDEIQGAYKRNCQLEIVGDSNQAKEMRSLVKTGIETIKEQTPKLATAVVESAKNTIKNLKASCNQGNKKSCKEFEDKKMEFECNKIEAQQMCKNLGF